MAFDLWLAFALAAAIVLAVPGPTIAIVVQSGLTYGRAAVPWSVGGTVLGDAIALAVSLAGLGTLLATSAVAFTAVKLIGAAYLLYLGSRALLAAFRRSEPPEPVSGPLVPPVGAMAVPGPTLLWRTTLVTALNPKSIAFFVAFLPQFVTAQSPAAPQLAILAATFLVLAGVNAALYGFGAGRLSRVIARDGVRRAIDGVAGSCLIAAGVATALARRA